MVLTKILSGKYYFTMLPEDVSTVLDALAVAKGEAVKLPDPMRERMSVVYNEIKSGLENYVPPKPSPVKSTEV